MPERRSTDGTVHHSAVELASVAEQLPISPFTAADVRRLEARGLLDACRSLHREGILDDHEYEAKRLALAGGLSHVRN
jgi:hypothetical protein